MSRSLLVHSEELCRYDFGPRHPMGPGRVRNAIALADALGVLDRFRVEPPGPIVEELLRTVHTEAYIAAVKAQAPDPAHGIGTTDNPLVDGMHEIAASIVMASVDGASAIWTGAAPRASNIAGGLHHARPDATSGFCVYNDVAVAIRWLLAHGAERIGYVDTDVHHGDGVQDIFYDDPRVLTISIHETPMRLFPGTGFPNETGGSQAPGSAINIALPPHTGDAGWLRAFHAVVPEALRAFGPQILVSQHGCDTHHSDPLADLMLTVDAQRAACLALSDWSDELCPGPDGRGRWLSVGGGGYSIIQAVPRAWTHLLGVVSGEPIDPETIIPQSWRDAMGPDAPELMTDGADARFRPFEEGYDPDSPLDQAIRATRFAVFPELGLDPEA